MNKPLLTRTRPWLRSLVLLPALLLGAFGAYAQAVYHTQNFDGAFTGSGPTLAPTGWTQMSVYNNSYAAPASSSGDKNWESITRTAGAAYTNAYGGSYYSSTIQPTTAATVSGASAPLGARSGNGMVGIDEGNFSAATAIKRLYSPGVTVSPSAVNPVVRMYYWYYQTTLRQNLAVVASADNGATWQVIGYAPSHYATIAQGKRWEVLNVPIPLAYINNANARFGFQLTATYSSGNVFVDDFSVQELPTANTFTAQVTTGGWGTPATWLDASTGLTATRTPGADDNVVIPSGKTVNLSLVGSADMFQCRNLTNYGTLASQSTSAQLNITGDLTNGDAGGTTPGVMNFATTTTTILLGGNLLNNISSTMNWTASAASAAGSTLISTANKAVTYTNNGTFSLVDAGALATFYMAGTGTVTFGFQFKIKNTLGLIGGTVNMNNLVLYGISGAASNANTILRSRGTLAGTWAAANINPTSTSGTSRGINVTYTDIAASTGLTSNSGFYVQDIATTLTSGNEIPTDVSVNNRPQISGTLTVNSTSNINLPASTTVWIGDGSAANVAPGFVLTRGIINVPSTSVLEYDVDASIATTGVEQSVSNNASSQGSYVVGRMRAKYPATASITRTFPLGEGTSLLNLSQTPGTPSNGTYYSTLTSNARRYATIGTGGTVWTAGTEIEVAIAGAPSGTINAPVTFVTGNRSFKVSTISGTPSNTSTILLSATNTVPGASGGANWNLGGGDNIPVDQADLLIAQSTALTGTWSSVSTASLSGAINSNNTTPTTKTSNALTSFPAASASAYYAWASKGSACFLPTALAVSSTTQTGVTFTFTPPTVGTPGGYDYVIYSAAATPTNQAANGTPAANYITGGSNLSGSPITVSSGLTANTTYYLYIRSNCSGTNLFAGNSNWTSGMSFTTQCNATTLPVTQSFENAGSLPACYSVQNVSGSSMAASSSYAQAGTYSIAQYINSQSVLYTQAYTMAASTNYQFTFYQKVSTTWAGATNHVMTFTYGPSTASQPNTIGTFTVTGSGGAVVTSGANQSDNSSTTWVQRTFYFTSGAAGDYVFGIRDNCATSTPYTSYFDVLNISAAPAYLPPTFSVGSIAQTTASITVTPPAITSPTGYEYDVRTDALAPGSAGSILTAANQGTSISLSGLTANTSYMLYMRSNYGGGNNSAWTAATTFTTLCNVVAVPLTQGFNSATLPSCWTYTTATGKTIIPGTTGANPTLSPQEGSYLLTFNGFSGAGNATLFSPPIDASALTTGQVSFYMSQDNLYTAASYPLEGVTLRYSINGGSTYNDVVFTNNHIATAAQWTKITANLPGTANVNGLIIAIYFNSQNGSNIHFDNFSFGEAPTCISPTSFSTVSATSTSGTFTYTPAGTGLPVAAYEIEVRTDGSSTPSSGALGSNIIGLEGSNSAASGNITVGSLGQTAPYTYYAYLRANCTSSKSPWVSLPTFVTPCPATNVPPAYVADAESNTVGALGCETSVAVGSGVTFKTSSTYTLTGSGAKSFVVAAPSTTVSQTWLFSRPLNLTASTSYTVSFKGAYDYATSYGYNFKLAYGTANTDAGMTSVIQASTPLTVVSYPASNTYSYTFTTPASVTNPYYVGVQILFGVNANSFAQTVLDDFTVTRTPTCFPVTGVYLSNLTQTAARVNYTAPALGSPSQYNIEVRTAGAAGSGSTGRTLRALTGTFPLNYNFSGLSANTTYTVYVQTICNPGVDSSAWTTGVNFTTPCNPQTIPLPVETVESTTVPALPSCYSQETVTGSTAWVSSSTYNHTTSGSKSLLLASSGSNWLYLPPFTADGTTSYRVTLWYYATNTITPWTITPSFGTSATATAMTGTGVTTTAAQGLSWINSGGFVSASFDFTPAAGTTYFGLKGASGSASLYVDDIKLGRTPTCFVPGSPVVASTSATSSSASWTTPVPTAPSNGYAYKVVAGLTGNYYDAAITSGNVGAGVLSANLTGLTTGSPYTLFVRGYCGGTDSSDWASVAFTQKTPISYVSSVSTSAFSYLVGGTNVPWATAAAGTFPDSDTAKVDLGTPVTFNGVSYNRLHISSNGWVALGAASSNLTTYLYTPLSTTGGSAVLAPFAGDLYSATTGAPAVTYGNQGSDFVVEWKDGSYYYNRSYGQRLSFQVRFSPGGVVKFAYDSISAGTNTTTYNVQVGIRTNGITYPSDVVTRTPVYGQINSWTNPMTGATNAALTPVNGSPAQGSFVAPNHLITFTPTPCGSYPITSAATALTTTGATANWSFAGSAGFELRYRQPTQKAATATVITGLSGSTTSYAITGLTPATTFVYEVRSTCGGGNFTEWSTGQTFSTNAVANDVAAVSVTPLVTCNSTPTLTVTLKNAGTATIPASTAVGFQVVINGQTLTGTATTVAAVAQNAIFTGTVAVATALPAGTYQTTLTAQYAGDAYNGNDVVTNAGAITYQSSVTSNGFVQGFEATGLPAGWSASLGTITANKLKDTSGTANPTLAPAQGSKYLFFNSFSITSGLSASLTSPCIQVASSCQELRFVAMQEYNSSYTGASYANEGIVVTISANGSSFSAPIGFFKNLTDNASVTYARRDNPALTAPRWTKYAIDLAPYAGQTIQIKFTFQSQDGDNVLMDNLFIYDRAATDAGISAIPSPAPPPACASNNSALTVTIKNYGCSNPINNIPVRVKMYKNATLVNTYDDTATVTIAPSATANWTITNVDISAQGAYSFVASTINVAGDTVPANNDFTLNLTVDRTNQPPTVVPTATPSALLTGSSTTLTAPVPAGVTGGTFSAAGLPLAIPDGTGSQIAGATVSANITVSGVSQNAADLQTVKIYLTHSYRTDVRLWLKSPSGDTVGLFKRRNYPDGTGGTNLQNLVLGTGGPSIGSLAPTDFSATDFTTVYTPERPFTNFTGAANGTWTVYALDGDQYVTGSLTSFSLTWDSQVINYSWAITSPPSVPAGFTGGPPTYTFAANTNPGSKTLSTAGTYNFAFTATYQGGCGQTTQVPVLVSDGNIWLGQSNLPGAGGDNWTNPANWLFAPKPPAAGTAVTVPPTGYQISGYTVAFQPAIASTVSVSNVTLLNQSGTSGGISVGTGGTLNIAGGVTGNLALISSTGTATINFNGTGAQQIDGDITVQNFKVSNTNTTGLTMTANSKLRVAPGKTLTMAANSRITIPASASLVLQSTILGGTARLAQVPVSAAINGNITVERAIPSTPGWYFAGAPIKNGVLSDWSEFGARVLPKNNSNIFKYTESDTARHSYNGYLTEVNGWKVPNALTDQINPSNQPTGYRIYANSSFIGLGGVFNTTGLPFVGGVTANFTKTPGMWKGGGFNLLANPYPSEINWDAVRTSNSAVPSGGTVQIWNNALGSYSNYVAGTPGGFGTNGGSNIIASGQAFFIQATGSGALAFAESHKSTANATSFFRTALPGNLIMLNLADGTHTDQALMVFRNDAEVGYDGVTDSRKSDGLYLNVSLQPEAGADLAINSRPDLSGTYELPVRVSAHSYTATGATYTLHTDIGEVTQTGYSVYLRDALLNTMTDLYTNPDVTFSMSTDPATHGNQRFTLVFQPQAVTSTKLVATPNVSVWPNPAVAQAALNVSLIQFGQGTAVLDLVDVLGRPVASKTVTMTDVHQTTSIPVKGVPAGVYVLRARSASAYVTREVVIK